MSPTVPPPHRPTVPPPHRPTVPPSHRPTVPPSHITGERLICATAVRQYVLNLSRDTRAGKFTRVSQSLLDDANAALAAWLRSRVRTTPSVGKTL